MVKKNALLRLAFVNAALALSGRSSCYTQHLHVSSLTNVHPCCLRNTEIYDCLSQENRRLEKENQNCFAYGILGGALCGALGLITGLFARCCTRRNTDDLPYNNFATLGPDADWDKNPTIVL